MAWKLQGLEIVKRKQREQDGVVPTCFSPDRGHGFGLAADKYVEKFAVSE